jgi:hypothetical protein
VQLDFGKKLDLILAQLLGSKMLILSLPGIFSLLLEVSQAVAVRGRLSLVRV